MIMTKKNIKDWQQTIDEIIIRIYSKSTKLKWFTKTSKLTINELAITLADDKYLTHLIDLIDDVVPSFFQLAFLNTQLPTYRFNIVDKVFKERIQNYHIEKNHKAFEIFCDNYYYEPIEAEEINMNRYAYDVETKIDTTITIPQPGEVIFNIGGAYNEVNGYICKGITLDDMIETNPGYAAYIIQNWSNQYYYETYFPYLKERLKERWNWDIDIHPDIVKRLKVNENI